MSCSGAVIEKAALALGLNTSAQNEIFDFPRERANAEADASESRAKNVPPCARDT